MNVPSEKVIAVSGMVATLALVGCANRHAADPVGEAIREGGTRVVTSCGAFFGTPPFAGRVARLDPNGTTHPLPNATFWRGIGEEAITDGTLQPLEVDVNHDGTFSTPVSISVSSTVTYRDGEIVDSDGWIEDVVLVIRAPGCDDKVVHFEQEWQAQDILLSCSAQ